jgi:hypothetical protein
MERATKTVATIRMRAMAARRKMREANPAMITGMKMKRVAKTARR